MIGREEYSLLVKRRSGPSPKPKDFILSFAVGGGICVFAQALFDLYGRMGLKEKTVLSAVPCTLIVLTAILTGIGLFDKLAKHAGAGTLVPITGFANAVCSSAVEFRNEGFVLGVGASIFKIAGPVILYGVSASVVYGIIYYIFKTVW